MKKRCEVCNEGFEAKNYWQKYCSNSCKQAMWAIKRFDKNILKKLLTKV